MPVQAFTVRPTFTPSPAFVLSGDPSRPLWPSGTVSDSCVGIPATIRRNPQTAVSRVSSNQCNTKQFCNLSFVVVFGRGLSRSINALTGRLNLLLCWNPGENHHMSITLRGRLPAPYGEDYWLVAQTRCREKLSKTQLAAYLFGARSDLHWLAGTPK